MDPEREFCHNPACRAYGRRGEGHIVIHSRREQRYRCERCRRTFSATVGTGPYRLHRPVSLVVLVLTLLAHGCQLQAIVAAFGLDELTVARWQQRAGVQCRRLHKRLVQAGQVEVGQVKADEVRVRIVGGVLWLAPAMAVPIRFWLGGVVRAQRNRALIRALLERVRACGPLQALLACTDGLASYARQAVRVFRQPLRTGRRGRPRLVQADGVLIAQAIKRYVKRRVVGVVRRIVRGSTAAVQAALSATQGRAEAVINTAHAERLNATFRARLAPLVRRTRAALHRAATLEAGLWLVGASYNFCKVHRSLRRRRRATDPPDGRWIEKTPAQAAGLTDHRWSLHELLTYPVPGMARKRRGRRPAWSQPATPAA